MGENSFHLYSTYLDYIDGNYDDEKLIANMKVNRDSLSTMVEKQNTQIEIFQNANMSLLNLYYNIGKIIYTLNSVIQKTIN